MSTHNIPFSKKEKSPLIILSLPLWDFSKGPKNEFEAAVVDEPSAFEPLKFYCNRYNTEAQYCRITQLLNKCTKLPNLLIHMHYQKVPWRASLQHVFFLV